MTTTSMKNARRTREPIDDTGSTRQIIIGRRSRSSEEHVNCLVFSICRRLTRVERGPRLNHAFVCVCVERGGGATASRRAKRELWRLDASHQWERTPIGRRSGVLVYFGFGYWTRRRRRRYVFHGPGSHDESFIDKRMYSISIATVETFFFWENRPSFVFSLSLSNTPRLSAIGLCSSSS